MFLPRQKFVGLGERPPQALDLDRFAAVLGLRRLELAALLSPGAPGRAEDRLERARGDAARGGGNSTKATQEVQCGALGRQNGASGPANHGEPDPGRGIAAVGKGATVTAIEYRLIR